VGSTYLILAKRQERWKEKERKQKGLEKSFIPSIDAKRGCKRLRDPTSRLRVTARPRELYGALMQPQEPSNIARRLLRTRGDSAEAVRAPQMFSEQFMELSGKICVV
jgi:hypothetical protein